MAKARRYTQASSRGLSGKSGGSLILISEGQSSNTKSSNVSEMQTKIDRLKSLLESANRRVEKEHTMSRFEVQLATSEDTQNQRVVAQPSVPVAESISRNFSNP